MKKLVTHFEIKILRPIKLGMFPSEYLCRKEQTFAEVRSGLHPRRLNCTATLFILIVYIFLINKTLNEKESYIIDMQITIFRNIHIKFKKYLLY
jgi:hypothetical protein